MEIARTFLGHRHGHRRCAGVILAAVGLLLAGCAGGGSSDAGGSDQGYGTSGSAPAAAGTDAGGDDSDQAALKITVDLTGATPLHGEASSFLLPFDQSGHQAANCAEYAKGAPDSGGKPIIQLPSVIAAQPMNGHQVLFTNQLDPYHGPGHYTADAFEGQGGGATVEIDGHAYAKDSSSTADTDVQPDGSGTVRFSGFRLDGGGTLAGTVSWTCHDR